MAVSGMPTNTARAGQLKKSIVQFNQKSNFSKKSNFPLFHYAFALSFSARFSVIYTLRYNIIIYYITS
jgi:hypothetical protein